MRYSSNLIKSDEELRQKFRDFSIFEKKTPKKIDRIKKHAIWISFRGEIKERKLEREIDCVEREKNKILYN